MSQRTEQTDVVTYTYINDNGKIINYIDNAFLRFRNKFMQLLDFFFQQRCQKYPLEKREPFQ